MTGAFCQTIEIYTADDSFRGVRRKKCDNILRVWAQSEARRNIKKAKNKKKKESKKGEERAFQTSNLCVPVWQVGDKITNALVGRFRNPAA